jgi:nicotinamide mononucleotide transporter
LAVVRASEAAGVGLNLAYTYFYLQGDVPFAYLFAALGAGALGFACWHRNLQAETALHAFYFAMAGYGAWLSGQTDWHVSTQGWASHFMALALGALAWWRAVPWLENRGSSMPRLDAFTTVFSVVGTWWMIQGDPVNWIYWMVIDTVSIYLYAKRGMLWGALLFAIYGLMAVDGWFEGISWFTG